MTPLLFLLTLIFVQPPEADLRLAEHQLATALTQKDTAAFERLLAPDFVLRAAPDVPRDAWIRNALTLCWGERFDISDFAVRTSTPDSAVVSLVLTTYQDPVTCEPATIRSLLTDVWVRQAGAWRLALRHSGPAGEQFEKIAPPPPRWERTAELSLVATGGNTDTQTLGASGSLLWRPGPWTTRARATYVKSVADDVETAESLVAEVRQSRVISPRLDAFARADYVVDRFAGIDFRSTVDAGLSWLLVDDAPHSLKADAGIGASHESRRAAENLTFAAGTASVTYRRQLSRTSELNEQARLTADLGSIANWRLENSLNLTVTMTRLLSVKVAHELKRVNRPVAGFRRTDTILSAALVARF